MDDPAEMTVAEVFLKALYDQGIEYVYPEEDYEYGGVKWVKEKGPDGNDQLKTNIGTTIPA